MKNAPLWIVAAIVVIALGAAAYFFMTPPPTVPAEEANTSVSGTIPEETPLPADRMVTVQYSASGFSPAIVTIKAGTRVAFVSNDGSDMWVATDEHPSHTGYDGTNKDEHCPNTANTVFDQCSRGSSYAFTFTKTGTWAYHNHADDDHRGTVIVTE